MIEGPASFPVGAEDLGAAAILLALGTFLCNKGSSGVEVPEGPCRRCGPVSLKIHAQKKAIWRSLAGGGLDPENPDRPVRLLWENLRAGEPPVSFQGASTEFRRVKIGYEQSLIRLIHIYPCGVISFTSLKQMEQTGGSTSSPRCSLSRGC